MPELSDHPLTRALPDKLVDSGVDVNDDELIDDRNRDEGEDDDDKDDDDERHDDDGGWDDDDQDGEGGDDEGHPDDVPWVTIATYWTPVDAQMARLRLESGGVDVVILDENIIATDWLYANAVGGIKLKVPAASADRALALLVRPSVTDVARNDGQPVSDGQILCPRCGSADIYPVRLSRRLSYLALFICSLLLPLALGRRIRCAACGYEWR